MAQMSKVRPWTQDEIDFMHEHYEEKGTVYCACELDRTKAAISCQANRLRIKTRVKAGKLRRPYETKEVLAQYQVLRSARKVAKALGISVSLVASIITKHGVAFPVKQTPSEMAKDAIIKDYQSCSMLNAEISAKYGIPMGTLQICYRRWGVLKKNRKEKLFANNLWRNNCRELNHSHTGRMGWYRDRFFRSMGELTFMIRLDAERREWSVAERCFSIPYDLEGKRRQYRPDFLVGNTLYEIKPKDLQKDPIVILKAEAALSYCRDRGMEYIMIDVPIDHAPIIRAYDEGKVKLHEKHAEAFKRWVTRYRE